MNPNWFAKAALGAVALIALFAFADTARAEAEKAEAEAPAPQKEEQKKAPYPLDVCPVSGGKLGEMGEPVVRTYGGREVRFCCASCIDKFEADLEAGLKKMDQLIIAGQKADYPLEVCLVSGEKLGEMGEPVDYLHDNQLVRFCCAHCIDTFKKDPGPYLKKLEEARAARKSAAPPSEPGEEGKKEGEQGHP